MRSIKMYVCVFILIMLILIPNILLGKTFISSAEKEIFKLRHIQLKMFAIENDMLFFIRWENKDKTKWEKPAKQAINDLNDLKSELFYLDLSQKLKFLQTESINLIEELKVIYQNIEDKPDDKIKKELDLFWKDVISFNNNFREVIKKSLELPLLPDDFDVINEEISYFDNQNNRTLFKKVVSLMQQEEYKKAYAILSDLLKNCSNLSVKGSIITRIVDCPVSKTGNVARKPNKTDHDIKLMDDFLKSNIYSPKLYRIFLQWRTINQYYNYGLSNWSNIPNEKYIEKRWQVVQNLIEHVEKYPKDIWAKYQILKLMRLSIIERGGSLFGNSNLIYMMNLRRWKPKDEQK